MCQINRSSLLIRAYLQLCSCHLLGPSTRRVLSLCPSLNLSPSFFFLSPTPPGISSSLAHLSCIHEINPSGALTRCPMPHDETRAKGEGIKRTKGRGGNCGAHNAPHCAYVARGSRDSRRLVTTRREKTPVTALTFARVTRVSHAYPARTPPREVYSNEPEEFILGPLRYPA